MMAIAVLGTLFLYGLLSFGIVWLVVRWAKKRGRSPVRWGIVAGLIMYHLVFWDLIPTLVVYKYYCATKAGFWVYKTPEQWKVENPGVAETLTWRERSFEYKAPGTIDGYWLNERFVWEKRRSSARLLSLSLSTESVIDTVTNEPMARRVNVGVGYPKGLFISNLKLFKYRDSYVPSVKGFGDIEDKFKKLGSRVK